MSRVAFLRALILYFIRLHIYMRGLYIYTYIGEEVRWMRRPTRLFLLLLLRDRGNYFSRRAPLISPRYGFYSVCAAYTKRFTRPECL
jgi:hypothetical protein